MGVGLLMNTKAKSTGFDKLSGLIYWLAVLFMPSILLFNLYNQNHIENHIIFTHVLILAGVLAIMGGDSPTLIRVIAKKP